MILNEKALFSAVKEAYRGGGYTVVYRPSGHYIINTGYWAVEIQKDNCPRELLSLLMLHMGIPLENGKAYRIMKSKEGPTVQTMVYDVALNPFVGMEEAVAAIAATPVWVVRTGLIYDGNPVWQKTGNLGIVLVKPGYESIFRSFDDIQLVENALYAEGEISKAFIGRVNNETPQIQHLAKIRWTAE